MNPVYTSRVKLTGIILLFAGPLVAAFIWYYGLSAQYITRASANYSPLISPPQPISSFSNTALKPQNTALTSLEKKWTWVHIINRPCQESCQKSLYHSRQTRLAVGKDMYRIQRLIVVQKEIEVANLIQDNPNAIFVMAGKKGIENQLGAILKKQKADENDTLLIDPMGNIMMQIPANLNPKSVLKDLKKLLKLSRIG